MSVHSLYEISRRSFRTVDAAMNITGQNIANVNTEGYSRKRITLSADSPVIGGVYTRIPAGASTGTGVSIAAYERMRDTLLDKAAWDAHATLGSAQEEHRVLSVIEGLFPHSGPGSLGGLLNDFWNAWSDLANQPTDNGVRLTVRSRAQALAQGLNRLDGDLQAFGDETKRTLTSGLEDANTLLNDIARLNANIRDAEMRGSPDYEAQDQRDQKVKALAEFAPVKVQNQTEGYTITIGGMTVLQGAHVEPLTLNDAGGTVSVEFGSTGVAYSTGGTNDGKLGAWLRTLNDTIPDTRAQLDQLAEALVKQVNALHGNRYDDAGNPVAGGDDFFHYSVDGLGNEDGVTASSIRLSAAVTADAALIGAPGSYTASGEEIAFAIAGLRQTGLAEIGNETAEHFAINLISDIGAKVRDASSKATAQVAVVDHLTAMGMAVSGVSLEEEMTNLIKYQQAFGAAARVLTATEEMVDTLLAM